MERTRDIATPKLDVRQAIGTGLGPRDPTTWVEHQTVWRATRMPSGPATYRVRYGPGKVRADAWGDGAEEVLELMPDLLGLHDEPEAFEPEDDFMARLHRENPGLRIGRGRRIIEALIPVILGQRVTTGEANSAYRRMVFKHSERAPGPGKLWLPPDPAVLRRLRTFELMGDDLDKKRARAVLTVCMHYKKLDKRQHDDPREVAKFMLKLPGIGPWTTMSTLGESHGWPDAVVVGDFHLPNMVAFALAGEPRGDDKRMLELLEPYRGQRARAVKLIGRSGLRAPKYGAKKASWGFYVDRGTRRHGEG